MEEHQQEPIGDKAQLNAQGQQKVDKRFTLCLRCLDVKTGLGKQLATESMMKHNSFHHQGNKGVQYNEWCYRGEEDKIVNVIKQQLNREWQVFQGQVGSPDKKNNTFCTKCKQWKRKQRFNSDDLEQKQHRGQTYKGECLQCKSLKKRDNKVAQKEKDKDVKHLQNQHQDNIINEQAQVREHDQQIDIDIQQQQDEFILAEHLPHQENQQNDKNAQLGLRHHLNYQNFEEPQETIMITKAAYNELTSKIVDLQQKVFEQSAMIQSLKQQLSYKSLSFTGDDIDKFLNKPSDQLYHSRQNEHSHMSIQFADNNIKENSENSADYPFNKEIGILSSKQCVTRNDQPLENVKDESIKKEEVKEEQKIDTIPDTQPEIVQHTYTQGVIGDQATKQFVNKYFDRFNEKGLTKDSLYMLVRHPQSYQRYTRGRIYMLNEDYYLKDEIIFAFFNLLGQLPYDEMQSIKILPKVFDEVKEIYHQSKNRRKKLILPAYENQRYVILPWYFKPSCHWCFILVDFAARGEDQNGIITINGPTIFKPMVYIADTVKQIQKIHSRQVPPLSSVTSVTRPTWCEVVTKFICLYIGKEIREQNITFKVLQLKHQGNNYDCGLLTCLYIWQFFQTKNIDDLLAFPWKAEFSQHFRFAVAEALGNNDLSYIEKLVQKKKQEITKPQKKRLMKTNENNTCLSLQDNTSQLNVSVLQSPHSPGQRSLETHPRRDQRFEREEVRSSCGFLLH